MLATRLKTLKAKRMQNTFFGHLTLPYSNWANKLPYLWALLGISCFAFTFPVTKFAMAELDPVFITVMRAFIASLFAIGYLIIHKARRPTSQQAIQLSLTALGIVFGFPILAAIGIKTTSVSHAGIISALLPLATAIVASLITKEKAKIKFWLCSGMAASLVILLSFNFELSHIGTLSSLNTGDIWLFLALPLGAFGYAMGGRLAQSMPSTLVICWILAISSPVSAILTLYLMPDNLWQISLPTVVSILYLALFSQLLGFVFWNKGLAQGGITKMSQLQLLQPFGTLLGAAVIIGEALTFTQLSVCAGVVGLIYLGKK